MAIELFRYIEVYKVCQENVHIRKRKTCTDILILNFLRHEINTSYLWLYNCRRRSKRCHHLFIWWTVEMCIHFPGGPCSFGEIYQKSVFIIIEIDKFHHLQSVSWRTREPRCISAWLWRSKNQEPWWPRQRAQLWQRGWMHTFSVFLLCAVLRDWMSPALGRVIFSTHPSQSHANLPATHPEVCKASTWASYACKKKDL